jgi:hypothetical protein
MTKTASRQEWVKEWDCRRSQVHKDCKRSIQTRWPTSSCYRVEGVAMEDMRCGVLMDKFPYFIIAPVAQKKHRAEIKIYKGWSHLNFILQIDFEELFKCFLSLFWMLRY